MIRKHSRTNHRATLLGFSELLLQEAATAAVRIVSAKGFGEA